MGHCEDGTDTESLVYLDFYPDYSFHLSPGNQSNKMNLKLDGQFLVADKQLKFKDDFFGIRRTSGLYRIGGDRIIMEQECSSCYQEAESPPPT